MQFELYRGGKRCTNVHLFIKPSAETNAVRAMSALADCTFGPDADRRQTLKIPVAVRQPPPEDITEKAAPAQKLSRRGLTYRLKSL